MRLPGTYISPAETGLYYLQSRYYDPELGRFISADGQISGVGGDLLGYNQFAYCFNNPVNMTDATGNWPSWGQVFAAVATVAVAAVFVAAVVASAGAVGVAAGVAAASIGASSTMISAAITVGTVGTYAVAAGIGACAVSNAGEILTGYNVIRDGVMGGNQEAYNVVQTGLSVVGGAVIIAGQTYPSKTQSTPNTKYPGNNPNKCEIPGFEWKGSGTPSSGRGNYVNMQTGEWLHPDLNHGPPIGPHWDYGVRGDPQTFRIFPDGTKLPK